MTKVFKTILFILTFLFVIALMATATSGYMKDVFETIAVEHTNDSQIIYQDLDFLDEDETNPPALNHIVNDLQLSFTSFYRQKNTSVFKAIVWQPPRV